MENLPEQASKDGHENPEQDPLCLEQDDKQKTEIGKGDMDPLSNLGENDKSKPLVPPLSISRYKAPENSTSELSEAPLMDNANQALSGSLVAASNSPSVLSTISDTSGNTTPVPSFSPSKSVVPLEMMPTIPLVPVQVPYERGGFVTVPTKSRGRPRGSFTQFVPARSGSPIGLTIRKGLRIKRFGGGMVRGSRRLVHSISLDDKGILGFKGSSPTHADDEVHYSQDDMFVAPSIQEKWPGKNCAFCCLHEFSQLGQGDIVRYEPTQGFNLREKDHFTEDVLREASVAKKFKSCLGSFKDRVKSPKKSPGDSAGEGVEELSLVGHTERPSLALLFTTIGQCFAHYMCALWSHGVEMSSDDAVMYVDKAVVTASETKCAYCKKLGASVPCKVKDCNTWYHFPCAMAAGSSMDMKRLSLVCPPHAKNAKEHLSDLNCMICEKNDAEDALLFCSSCGSHYHGQCLKPSLSPSAVLRAGWQCPGCKSCQTCRHPSDEIICIVCDKAYHATCARPQGLTHSRGEWKCRTCRVCGDCGSKTPGSGLSSRWHSNFTVCDSCYQLRNKGLACPICKKAYRVIMQKIMAQCSMCRKYVHNHCDREADVNTIQTKWNVDKSYEYTCSVCRINPMARIRKESGSVSSRSPDREDFPADSICSEDSNDTEISLDESGLAKSPFSQGGLLSLSTSSSNSTIPSLSTLSNSQSGNLTDKPHDKPNSNNSYLMKSNYSALARRGVLFPRMRGAVSSKLNIGKRGFPSGRKRGSTSLATGRKGRGNPGMQSAKGYRGYFNFQQVQLQVQENNQNSNKEEGEENKIILVDAADRFSLWQDVCVMCGSFGQDTEGRLIACSQCGQCFHPYCANVKVNRVVLEKGWRCLDCTVCEGCGERNDEGRLVLCEDCDISCHIYCMTPPLDQVPAGIWKCKWCAVCQYCSATEPGKDSLWQQNYSMCGPCFSLSTCPVCDEAYTEAELIIQCSDCNRWLHASDDMIHTEDEAERCIEKGYVCLMCRSPESLPPHMLPPSPPRIQAKPQVNKGPFNMSGSLNSVSSTVNHLSMSIDPDSPSRSMSPQDFMSKTFSNTQHWMDGTCLSDLGYHQIQNLTLPPVKKPRNTGPESLTRSVLCSRMLKGVRQRPSLDSTGSRDMDEEDEEDDEKMDTSTAATPQHWVYGMKEGTLLNAQEHGDPPNLPEGYYTLPGPDQGTFILRKRRYRNIKTVGIGGFQVRARARKDDEEKAREEAEMDPQALEIRRRRSKWRTKKKIKLLEKFPSYIQEAFFGRNLMDTSNLEDEKNVVDELEDTEAVEPKIIKKEPSSIRLSQDEVEMLHAAKEKHELAKVQKLNEPQVYRSIGDPKGPNPRSTSSPFAIGMTKEHGNFGGESAGNAPSGAQTVPKVEEKRPKEEKVEDLVEDDENNDAIEALFGMGGSALISDDLVRDIMNDEMKNEDTSFVESEDRDQIDSETNVDSSKLTDLLGPGFNLEDVDDIMKNLRDETADDSNSVVSESSSTTNPNTVTDSTRPLPTQPVQSALLEGRLTSNVPQPVPPQGPIQNVPIENPVKPLHGINTLPLPSQSQLSELQVRNMPHKLPNLSMAQQEIPNPVITYERHSPSVRPSFPSQVNKPLVQGQRSNPEFSVQNRMLAVSNSMHMNTNIPKSVGLTNQQNVILASRDGQNLTSHSMPMQRVEVQNVRPRMPFNQQGVVQPNSISSMVISRPANAQSFSNVPNQPAQYSHQHQQQPRPNLALNTASGSPLQKIYSAASESQSLSLSLEEDEALGDKATKAAVLYANIHNPTLRNEVTLVQDRERQIKRMWKNLDAEQRKLYAQKARENKKEYFKNKQEYQRALKTQEKEAASSSGVTMSQHVQNTGESNTNINPNVSSSITLQRYQPDLSIMQSRNQSHLGTIPAAVSIEHPNRNFSVNAPNQANQLRFRSNTEMPAGSQSQSGQMTGISIQRPVANVSAPNTVYRTIDGTQSNSSNTSNNGLLQSSDLANSQMNTRPVTLPNQDINQGQIQVQRPTNINQTGPQSQTVRQNLPYVQFRQPLPPLGVNQQIRIRGPVQQQAQVLTHTQRQFDPRTRMIVQQRISNDQLPRQLQQSPLNQQISQNEALKARFQQQNLVRGSSSVGQNVGNQPNIQMPLKMAGAPSPSNLPPGQGNQHVMTIQNKDSQESVSELPESVTRDLEQLEKEQEKHQTNMGIGISSNTELSQMEEDLLCQACQVTSSELQHDCEFAQQLTGIGDFKDLLEYAVSDKDRASAIDSPKLTDSIFENLVEEVKNVESKEGQESQVNPQSRPASGRATPSSNSSGPTATGPSSANVGSRPGSALQNMMIPSPTMIRSPVPSQQISNPGSNSEMQSRSSPMYNFSPGSMNPHDHSPGSVSPLTRLPMGVSRAMTMGVPSSPTLGGMGVPSSPTLGGMGVPSSPTLGGMSPVMGSPNAPPQSPQMMQPCPVRPMNQIVPPHLQQQQQQQSPQQPYQQVYGGHTMNPRSAGPAGSMAAHMLRPQRSPGAGPGPHPPPPYPGHGPSYPRPQFLAGDGVFLRGPPMGPSLMGYHGMGSHRMLHTHHMVPQGTAHGLHRPLLIQEQRLLMEDIIEEEKRELMKKKVNTGQLSQVAPEGPMGVSGTSSLRPSFLRNPTQLNSGQIYGGPSAMNSPHIRPNVDPGLHPALLQAGSRPAPVAHTVPMAIKTLPPPPQPPDNPQTEAEFQMQQQYENWLNQQNNLISSQQKYFETEINKLRRQKKSLNSRQRTLKKNGQELNDMDAAELERVQREASTIQKQLDSCRKATRQHSMLLSEYNTKKHRQNQIIQASSPGGISPQPLMSGPVGQSGSSPMHAPHSPLMSHSPSSQHSIGMSPMVPSPHTPVASPNPTAMPQHSPHSMVVHPPHPSPGDHCTNFSPQARMPSPSNSNSYAGSPQAGQTMIGHQGMRIRMPVVSPGGHTSQGNQMSPHMMVIRQNYPPGAAFSQQPNQGMGMRQQYPQNVVPIRRPSVSGPVLSPSSNTGGCQSPSGPVPSPVSGMSMRQSPVHTGLRSPMSLPSPQMLAQYENPGTPLTPRSNEMVAHFNESSNAAYQPGSPHPSKMAPTPPSPYVNPSSVLSNVSTIDTNVGSVGLPPDSSNNSFNKNVNVSEFSMNQPFNKSVGQVQFTSAMGMSSPSVSTPNSGENNAHLGGGGGGNSNAPIPIVPLFMNCKSFGLKGGSALLTRWGHRKMGLRGGYPSPGDENINDTSTPSFVNVPTSSDIATSLPQVSTAITTTAVSHSGLSVDQSKSFSTDNCEVKRPSSTAYPEPIFSQTSCITSEPVAQSTVRLVSEPSKSDIPPSSRHQAVIGIPGGGAIISQPTLYSTPNLNIGPGIFVPLKGNSTVQSSYPTGGKVETTSSTSTLSMAMSSANMAMSSSNLALSLGTSNAGVALTSNPVGVSVKPPSTGLVSLTSDVNTLAAVANVSSQVNNLSLIKAKDPEMILTQSSSNIVNVSSDATEKVVTTINSSSISTALHSTPSILSSIMSTTVGLSSSSNVVTTVSTSVNLSVHNRISSELQNQNPQLPAVQNVTSPATATQQARMAHTLHHYPQHRLPVLLTSGNQSNSSVQVITQQGQILTSNIPGQAPRILSATQQQQRHPTNLQQNTSTTQQKFGYSSPAQINTNQMTKTQVVQSLSQYGHVVQSTPSGQFIVQQQHQPTGVVFSNNGSHVRMVGQPVVMQQGMLRSGGVVVKSSSPVQGGVRMMMIHNPGQPMQSNQVTRQTGPMMPPPVAKSPALTSGSPISRVSPAPSPIANVPSPHSPQIRSQSPHMNSPTHPTQYISTSTPPISGVQLMTRKDGEEVKREVIDKAFMPKTENDENAKEVQIPTAPNALLKQLLQNASCATNSGQSTQLVFLRSTPTGFSTHLSHVANQIPNPSSVTITKPMPDSTVSNMNVFTPVCNQNRVQPQLQKSITVTQSQDGSDKPVPNSNIVQVVSQPFGAANMPKSVVINPTTIGNNVYSNQILQAQNIRPLPTHLIRQDANGHTRIVQGTPNQGPIIRSNLHLQSQATPNLVSHCRSQTMVATSGNSPTPNSSPSINQIIQNSQASSPLHVRSPSLTENADNRSEMHIGMSDSHSGDLTPDLDNLNDDDDDFKRGRRKTPNQNRRKSQSKDCKTQPGNRVRQPSRVEEDYDAYIEGMMTQLRAMPPITVAEPFVPKNFNVCPIYGSGDLAKLGFKDYNHISGLLEGVEGSLTVRNMNDYYNTQPFGPIPPRVSPAKKGPTQRAFYNQEFTPPKIGLPIDDHNSEVEAACLNKIGPFYYRESDSPDTVLSSSSPECVMPESPPPLRGLHLVDMEDDAFEESRKRSVSPDVPLLVPIPMWASKAQGDKKYLDINKENLPINYSNITVKNKIGLSPAIPLKDMGNVTVSLTLSSNGSQDVSNVLRSLANLLNIPPPVSYNITDHSFDSGAAKLKQIFKHTLNGNGKEQIVDMQSALNGMVKFCKQCNSLSKSQVSKKLAEMPFLSKSSWEGVDDISFCSNSCYIQFALAHKPAVERSATNFMSIDGSGNTWDSKEGLKPVNKRKNSVSGDNLDDSFKEVLKVPQFEENRGVKHKLEEEYPVQPDGKRFKGHQYKHWNKDTGVLPNDYEKPTNKEMTDLLFGMQITYREPRLPEDGRRCAFCPLYGDSVADSCSRLLNYDLDKWVHLNCALWAEDVYETMSGSLMSVELALKKSANLICCHCEYPGASIKCFKVRCSKVYHLNCAKKEGCTFYKNKTVYCPEHMNKGDKENELSTLAVSRRVYIEREENRQIAAVMHNTEMNSLIRIGSLVLMNIGQLLPHQIQAFHSPQCIYPIGYQVIRFYWSMRHLHKRCAYECSIGDSNGEPEFKIVVREDGYEDATFVSRSPKGVWNKILEPIVEMRQKGGVVKLFSQYISGDDLFGLTEPAIVRILESMPGVDSLADYTQKFGSNPLFELPLAVNPTGCARSEPFSKTQTKRHHGLRTHSGTTKTGNIRTAATLASFTINYDPFAKSSHTRYFQCKKMKNEWRTNVYLARSKIQGLGLYAARDIEKNTPIIEYIGEIIRSEVAEVREKRYEAQNRGIYMFRLDTNRVVDATATGGLARYVNHSCGPNCFTETVEVDRDVKIVIISNRKISRGEELAYDYKFDEEEDHKIPCMCGAENCRKWMN